MQVRIDPQTERPAIDMALAHGPSGSVTLNLTPVRFEFLCRVADGALPESFSNECLEDLLAFKAKLLRKSELIRSARRAEDEHTESEEDQGTLTLSFWYCARCALPRCFAERTCDYERFLCGPASGQRTSPCRGNRARGNGGNLGRSDRAQTRQ